MLIVLDPERSSKSTLDFAVPRSRALGAQMTVMCLWRPPLLINVAALAGGDPGSLLAEQEQSAARWLRKCIAELPRDLAVRSVCCSAPADLQLEAELGSRAHTELVTDGALRGRGLDRLRRRHPELSIVLVEPRPAGLNH